MPGWQRIYEERGRPRLVVVCAVDFSEASRAAALEAAHVAAGGRLYLVYAASPRDDAAITDQRPPRGVTGPESAELRLFGWANGVTSRFPGTDVQTAVLGGGPAAEAVVRFAREHGCDLLVVGRRSRSTFGRATLGSVSEAILGSAPCPVLVMPPPAARELLAREGFASATPAPEVTAPP